MKRREFLAGATFAAGAAALAGCATKTNGADCAAGAAPMKGFRAAPLKSIRVGFVGLGKRGSAAVKRVSGLPGVVVAAICDNVPERIAASRKALNAKNISGFREYGGDEGWKALCDSDLDVVYNATPWYLHAPIGLYAMNAGKHVMIEVPSAMYLDECWNLVETAEKTRRHCMQLENCCYGEAECLGLVLCREKIFGELLYGECGYIHDRRPGVFSDDYVDHWRMMWNVNHRGDQYPTHGLGPICRYMDVNFGDSLDFLVSVDTMQAGYEAYAKAKFPGTWKARQKFKTGDATFTTIRTKNGRVIVIKHDTTSPRPYTRINRIQGTKGMFEGAADSDTWPMRMMLDRASADPTVPEKWMDDKDLAAVREKYRHPLWKKAGELALKVGGHGGMDFLMDLRWPYCLRNGLPLDMDVYDLATWCSVCELSERSVLSGSRPQNFPDFTRGAWKTAKPLPLADIDMSKAGFQS